MAQDIGWVVVNGSGSKMKVTVELKLKDKTDGEKIIDKDFGRSTEPVEDKSAVKKTPKEYMVVTLGNGVTGEGQTKAVKEDTAIHSVAVDVTTAGGFDARAYDAEGNRILWIEKP